MLAPLVAFLIGFPMVGAAFMNRDPVPAGLYVLVAGGILYAMRIKLLSVALRATPYEGQFSQRDAFRQDARNVGVPFMAIGLLSSVFLLGLVLYGFRMPELIPGWAVWLGVSVASILCLAFGWGLVFVVREKARA